jgi:MGT family glycosyltransferase
MLPVAQALERAGHELAFFCHEDISSALKGAGLAAPLTMANGTQEKKKRQTPTLERLSNPRWLTGWCAFGMKAVLTPAFLEPLRAMVRAFKPDVLCLDPLAYHGVLVALQEQLPWVGLSTNLLPLAPPTWRSPMVEAFAAIADERAHLFAAHGVAPPRFKVNEAVSPWLNTVFTTEQFVPRAGTGNDWSVYVGPSLPEGRRDDEQLFPWEQLPRDRPIVYVAFGSQISYGEELTQELVHEAAREAHVVVALKDQLERRALPFPKDVTAVRYAPQLPLLERCAAMVTHGGANSVMECLAKGCPMIVIPSVNDGFLQGLLVEQAGAGHQVPLTTASAAVVGRLLRELVAEGSPQRLRARALSKAYAAAHGASRTAALAIHVAQTREPINALQPPVSLT